MWSTPFPPPPFKGLQTAGKPATAARPLATDAAANVCATIATQTNASATARGQGEAKVWQGQAKGEARSSTTDDAVATADGGANL